jgi:thioredoxin reductase (NADPH)
MALKTLIIGSGPAGYTAAIYASRSSLNPVLYEGLQPGGQLTQTTEIENFPGYPDGTTGQELMDDLRTQAERLGTEIREGIITKVNFSKDGSAPHQVITDDGTVLEAHTLIISTGASAKYLGLADEQKYAGMGVSACATCDGFFYRGKDVAVVGGGDTACEEATYLAGLCNHVYLIVRKPYLRASKAMQQRVFNTPNIEVLFEHNTLELYGSDMGVEGARLIYRKGEADEAEKDIKIDGFFLAIGHHPNSEVFRKYIHVDEQGYILTEGSSTRTNVPGVFAAGDIMDPVYRQGIAAAGMGCRAAIDVERYLGELESK